MTHFSLQFGTTFRRVTTLRPRTALSIRLQEFLVSVPFEVSAGGVAELATAIAWSAHFPVHLVETGDEDWPVFLLQANMQDGDAAEVLALNRAGQLRHGTRPGPVRRVMSEIQDGQSVMFLTHRNICAHAAYSKPPYFMLDASSSDRFSQPIVTHVQRALGRCLPVSTWKQSAELIAQNIKSFIVQPAEIEIRVNAWRLMRRHLAPEIADFMDEQQTAHPQIYNWLAQQDPVLAKRRLALARMAPNMVGLMMDPACANMATDDLIGDLNDRLGAPSSPAFWYMARSAAVDMRFNSQLWPPKPGPISTTSPRYRPPRAQLRAKARVLSSIDPTWFPMSYSEDSNLTASAYQLVKVARTFQMDLPHLIQGICIPDKQPAERWRNLRDRLKGALGHESETTPISEWFMTAFYVPVLRPMLPVYDFDVYTDLVNTFMRSVPFWRILERVTAFAHYRTQIAAQLLAITGSTMLPGSWARPTPTLVHEGVQGRSLVMPVDERKLLHLLARVMGNCLDSYLFAAAQGHIMLSLVLDLDKLEAAVGPLPKAQEDRRRYVYAALRDAKPAALEPVVVEYRTLGPRTSLHYAEGVRRRRVMTPREAEAIRWYEQVLLTNSNATITNPCSKPAQEPVRMIFQLMERADQGTIPILGPDAAQMREAVFRVVRPLSPTKEGRNAGSVMRWMKIYKLDYIVFAECIEHHKAVAARQHH